MLSVVIPYFQRTPGLLRRCVTSILAQSCSWPVRVVVADDSSPVPAETEIGDLVNADERVRIVVQPNSGAGAARNRALDHLHADTRFVGLLDSDDWWEPGFASAVEAAFADEEVDLFFSDSRRFGKAEPRFLWETDPALNLRGEDHTCVDAAIGLHDFAGDFFDFMIRRSSIIGTSSMVYRVQCASGLRFDTTLYNGQDRLFKLRLARRIRRARFSTLPLSSEGEGINIFDSAQWGTGKAMRLASSYIQLGKKVRDDLPLSPAQRHFVASQIDKARREFLGNAMHMTARGDTLDRALTWRTIVHDPVLIGLAPVALARAAFSKLVRK